MSFRRSSRMVNTSRTVVRKRLRRSATTLFVMPARDLVLVVGYVSMITPGFNPVDVGSPDVYRKHDGERRGGAGDDAPR